jgi:hypothetical protein
MKSIIVDGSICRCFQKIGTSIYVLSCIVYFNVFLKVSVYLSATCIFKKQKFIKMGSCYCELKTKEKSVLCKNSVISILLRSRYILY